MSLEEKLIKLRNEKYLSQEELAEKLNVTVQVISDWESGISKPDIEKIVEIANFYNISTDSLLNVSNESEPIKEKKRRKEGIKGTTNLNNYYCYCCYYCSL